MRSASWIRKGLSRETNNVVFWSKPHTEPGWAGQNATALLYNATGGPWVPAKRDVSQDREGGESDSVGGESGVGGYKRLGASLTGVCARVLVYREHRGMYTCVCLCIIVCARVRVRARDLNLPLLSRLLTFMCSYIRMQ
jgi:hypothetical protein